jgi:ABC-2 type transport system permease protein
MSRFWILLQKELWHQFKTPLAWIVVAAFSGFCSLWLFTVVDFFAAGIASLRPLFAVMPYATALSVPAITMRSWTEERAARTSETLLSLPVLPVSLVIAKFISAFVVIGSAIVATILIPILVSPFGEFDSGETLGQYLGIMLLGFSSAAVGQWASSVSRSQIGAFLLAAGLLLFLALTGLVAQSLEEGRAAVRMLRFISTTSRLESFERGILSVPDATFFLSLAGIAVVGTVLAVRRRGSR